MNKKIFAGCLIAFSAVCAEARSIVWEEPPAYAQAGLPFADGVQGFLVWGSSNVLNVTVGRADLWDHRGGYTWSDRQSYENIRNCLQAGDEGRLLKLFEKKTPPGEPRNPFMLPLGRISFDMGKWHIVSARLDPYSGCASVSVTCGVSIAEISLAQAEGQLVVGWPTGVSPRARAICAWESPCVRKTLESIGFVAPETWEEGNGGGFEWRIPDDRSVSLSFGGGTDASFVVSSRGNRACPVMVSPDRAREMSARHWACWWNDAAQVSVPDVDIQEIYDYGFYRFGAMTDPNGVAAPLQGPWYEDCKLPPWNGDYHFNVNVQMCYWPAFHGNKPQNLMPLFRMVRGWWPILRENARKYCGVKDGFMLPHSVDDRGTLIGGFWSGTIDHGSTAWVAQMMFRYVRLTGDVEFLRSDAYPFMVGAMKVYRAMMEERGGKLSIAATTSPEWWGAGLPDDGWGRDASFQLAACHRLCEDLIAAAEMLGDRPDPMWMDVRARLPKYALARQTSCVRRTDEEIGLFEGRRLGESHRHHSHMAGIVPFDTIDFDADAITHERVCETYLTWIQHGPGLWSGWSMPWAAMLHTRIGSADMAVWTLKTWKEIFNNSGHGSRHNPYYPGFSLIGKKPFSSCGEGDCEVMQMDGAMAAVAAIQELLCHERQGVVRLFVGAPARWKCVSFRNILVSGGFLVEAERRDGRLARLLVKATRKGEFKWFDGRDGGCVRTVYMNAGETRRIL